MQIDGTDKSHQLVLIVDHDAGELYQTLSEQLGISAEHVRRLLLNGTIRTWTRPSLKRLVASDADYTLSGWLNPDEDLNTKEFPLEDVLMTEIEDAWRSARRRAGASERAPGDEVLRLAETAHER